MGSQGFRNISGNPFVYQEDTRSAAFGLDAAAQKWKISIKATAGALPTDTAQLTIDPATNGDVTIDPNGSGNFVVTSGNVSLTSGNLALPTSTATVGQITINGNRFLHAYGADTNVFLGKDSGNLSTVSNGNNFGLGTGSLGALTSGGDNCALGTTSLGQLTTGGKNLGLGTSAGYGLVGGSLNVCAGAYTGYFMGSGSNNVLIGSNSGAVSPYASGGNYTGSESSNICIHNYGVVGESNKIRIGTQGTGAGQQNAAYIAGIYGVSVGATNGLVYIDNAGQLGSTNSPSVTGSMTAGTGFTATTGGLTVTAGNIALPNTTAFTSGCMTVGGTLFFHTNGPSGSNSVYLGKNAGSGANSVLYKERIGIGTNACANAYGSPGAPDTYYLIGIGTNTLSTAADNGNCQGGIAIGYNAHKYCPQNALGSIAIGHNALPAKTGGGNSNIAIGDNSLLAFTCAGRTGTNNIAIGGSALSGMIGSAGNCNSNIAIGVSAGSAITTFVAVNNIYIGNVGANEANTIRIGTQGTQTASYMAGVYGVTPGGTVNVALVDSNGQLGSTATLSPALGGAMTWTEVTGTSQAAAVGNGYITNNVALVTVTLPSTAAVGQRVAIVGKGAGLWKLAQNSGQTIHFGSTDSTIGTGGYLAATVRYDCLEVICITANTDWVVRDSVGSITIV